MSPTDYLKTARALIQEWGQPLVYSGLDPEERVHRKAQYSWAWGVLDAKRDKVRPVIFAHPEYLVGYDGGPPPEKQDEQKQTKDQALRAIKPARRTRKRYKKQS
jgi:hypothetical protein